MLGRSAVLLALIALGCVDTSADRVELNARVDKVALAVSKTTLVTVLTGQFDLVVDLGDLASGDRVIERAPSLRLVKEADQSLVRNIDALPDGATFPITISPGQTRTLNMVLTDQNTLSAEQFDSVCSAPLVVAGSVNDSETGHSVPFSSRSFTPSGCP